MIHAIGNKRPHIAEDAFIAWNAEVAGEVSLGAGTSVWFSATLRGDIAPIIVGEGSNIQDGSTIHVDTNIPCIIGKGVTIGHGCILHSCTIEDGSLIGMGAIILNGAKIGPQSMVGAGALVTPGKEFPPRSLILGAPAKVVRELSEEEIANIQENARHYQELAQEAKHSYTEI